MVPGVSVDELLLQFVLWEDVQSESAMTHAVYACAVADPDCYEDAEEEVKLVKVQQP